MAMLAEKRTKTRYYLHHKTLNPRGNLWCEDNSKFGQRMLEKMGWSEGKGLGVKENGSTDPVHVSYKWDNKGMGYKGADGDEAVAQQKDFDALLATLSQKMESSEDKHSITERSMNSNSPASLELRSQKSRARVHYHKFTRGKDLSRATSKDLASILGMAVESQTPALAPLEPLVVPDVGPPIESSMETTFGITTIARGNINEYFKQKYNERKRKLESPKTPVDSKKSKDLHDVTNRDTSITTDAVEDIDNSSEINVEIDGAEKQRRKKKKKNKNINIEANSDTSLLDQSVPDIDASSSKSRRKSVTWGDVEVSFVSKYIKDMVDTSSESISGDLSLEATENQTEPEESTLTPDKKKKKKKKKDRKKDKVNGNDVDNGLNGLDLDYSVDDVFINDDDDAEDFSSNKKMKKKGKADIAEENSDNQSYNSCQESDANLLENIESNDSVSKKIKKKKAYREEVVATTEDDDSTYKVSEEISHVNGQEKKKKKKPKESPESSEVLPPPAISNNDSKSKDYCSTEDKTSKKKKKKKLKKQIDDEKDEDEGTLPTLTYDSGKKKRKRSANAEDLGGNQRKEDCIDEKKDRKKKKRDLLGSTDDLCSPSVMEGNEFCDILPDAVSVRASTEKKKKKKSSNPPPSDDVPEHNKSESKKKGAESVCEEITDSIPPPSETSDQPVLSALTQSRMAKWKERRKVKEPKSEQKETSEEVPKKTKNSSQTVLEVNPGLPTQNYNHRRVLAALGYNVKQGMDKNITIYMPSSNFNGSNLDLIPGYGQVVNNVKML